MNGFHENKEISRHPYQNHGEMIEHAETTIPLQKDSDISQSSEAPQGLGLQLTRHDAASR
jgi:hypothetical protein